MLPNAINKNMNGKMFQQLLKLHMGSYYNFVYAWKQLSKHFKMWSEKKSSLHKYKIFVKEFGCQDFLSREITWWLNSGKIQLTYYLSKVILSFKLCFEMKRDGSEHLLLMPVSFSLLIVPTLPLEILIFPSYVPTVTCQPSQEEMGSGLSREQIWLPSKKQKSWVSFSAQSFQNGTQSSQRPKLQRCPWLDIRDVTTVTVTLPKAGKLFSFPPWFSKLSNTLPNALFSLHQPETASVSLTHRHRHNHQRIRNN